MPLAEIANPPYELVQPFTRAIGSITPGQFVWSPVPNLLKIPKILEAKRKTPTDHINLEGTIRDIKPTDFRPRTDLPIAALPRAPTEEYLITLAKLRLCLVLARSNTEIKDANVLAAIKGKVHLHSDDLVLMPLYGVVSPNHAGGFPTVMVDRIRKMLYKQYLYFPKFDAKGSQCQDSEVYESIARFDRLFVCSDHYKWMTVTDVKLKGEPHSFVLGALADYLNLGANASYKEMLEIIQTE